jgi:hypothetical protein
MTKMKLNEKRTQTWMQMTMKTRQMTIMNLQINKDQATRETTAAGTGMVSSRVQKRPQGRQHEDRVCQRLLKQQDERRRASTLRIHRMHRVCLKALCLKRLRIDHGADR